MSAGATVAPVKSEPPTAQRGLPSGNSSKRVMEVAVPRAFELELHTLLDNNLTIGDSIVVPAFTKFAATTVDGEGVDPLHVRLIICGVVIKSANKPRVMRRLAKHVPWMQLLRSWLKQGIADKQDAVVDSVLRVLDVQAPPPAEVIKKSQIGTVVGDLSHKVFKKKKKTSEHVADAVRNIADKLIKAWSDAAKRAPPAKSPRAVNASSSSTNGNLKRPRPVEPIAQRGLSTPLTSPRTNAASPSPTVKSSSSAGSSSKGSGAASGTGTGSGASGRSNASREESTSKPVPSLAMQRAAQFAAAARASAAAAPSPLSAAERKAQAARERVAQAASDQRAAERAAKRQRKREADAVPTNINLPPPPAVQAFRGTSAEQSPRLFVPESPSWPTNDPMSPLGPMSPAGRDSSAASSASAGADESGATGGGGRARRKRGGLKRSSGRNVRMRVRFAEGAALTSTKLIPARVARDGRAHGGASAYVAERELEKLNHEKARDRHKHGYVDEDMGYGPVTKWSRPVPVFVGTVQNPDERAPLPQVNSDERDVQAKRVRGVMEAVYYKYDQIPPHPDESGLRTSQVPMGDTVEFPLFVHSGAPADGPPPPPAMSTTPPPGPASSYGYMSSGYDTGHHSSTLSSSPPPLPASLEPPPPASMPMRQGATDSSALLTSLLKDPNLLSKLQGPSSSAAPASGYAETPYDQPPPPPAFSFAPPSHDHYDRPRDRYDRRAAPPPPAMYDAPPAAWNTNMHRNEPRREPPRDRSRDRRSPPPGPPPGFNPRNYKRTECMFFAQNRCKKGDACTYLHNGK